MKKIGFTLFILLAFGAISKAQILDEIIGVVADRVILRSDIEIANEQISKQTGKESDSIRCDVFKQKLVENLMIIKALVDSLPVNEERIDAEIEERIRYFTKQYGGE